MFSLLKDWINERGSAAIMEKRIALIQDEKSALEKAKSALEGRILELQAELAATACQLTDREAEVSSLKTQLSTYVAPMYTPQAERALVQLSRFTQPEKTSDLAERLNLSHNVTLHMLCELEKLDYVRGTRWSEYDVTWLVTDAGRRHLASRGLLT